MSHDNPLHDLRDAIAALTEHLPDEVAMASGELVPRAEAVAALLRWAGADEARLRRAVARVEALAGPAPPVAPSAPAPAASSWSPPEPTPEALRAACDRMGPAGVHVYASLLAEVERGKRWIGEAVAVANAIADADARYRTRLGACRSAKEAAAVLATAANDPYVDRAEMARLKAAGFGYGEVSASTWPRAGEGERDNITRKVAS